MRTPVTLLCWLLAAPALADTTLFDDGRWRVEGVNAAAEPLPIAVSQRGTPLGSFAALRIFFSQGDGFVPVLGLSAGGTLEPTLPPPGVPGATAVLARYADCMAGLTPPLRFVALELPKKAKPGHLELRGSLSNLDSLEADDLRLRVLAPKPDRLRIELRYRLVATRDLCIDLTSDETDAFRAVEFVSQYLSPQQQLSDLTRYVKDVDLDCGVLDCDLDRISFCAALENATGPVIDNPKRLLDRHLELLHTTDAPAATPSLSVELRMPKPHAFKPQGAATESGDPAARNVSFWADWVDVRHETRAGKRVGSFRFALEARAPGSRSCDRTQP